VNRPQQAPRQDGIDETLFAAAVGIAGTIAAGHWLAANLAAIVGRGRLLHGSFGDALAALTKLPQHAGNPRLAWAEPARSNLPGPVVYWTAVVVVTVVVLALGALVMQRLGSRRHEPPDKRRCLGVDTQARLATTKDLHPLLTREPAPGLLVLAHWGAGSAPPRPRYIAAVEASAARSPCSGRRSRARPPA